MDLHSSVDDLAKLMKGRDAVYFTAGSRGKDLLQTDAYGAVKTMQAAKKLGIERYILVQSLLWNLTSGISMAWIKLWIITLLSILQITT